MNKNWEQCRLSFVNPENHLDIDRAGFKDESANDIILRGGDTQTKVVKTPKIAIFKRSIHYKSIFSKTIILGIHVSFQGCTHSAFSRFQSMF